MVLVFVFMQATSINTSFDDDLEALIGDKGYGKSKDAKLITKVRGGLVVDTTFSSMPTFTALLRSMVLFHIHERQIMQLAGGQIWCVRR